ncbi:recombinase family protein [Acetivibrio cellulolyticus]|uniref:recombinase family protein n=1 Tax=Acetivibrio cellulolyticus TaxID=35830 RepID=UPI0001E2C7B0|nr:recombinase family protein [Acetivibrio cellulolyticus]
MNYVEKINDCYIKMIFNNIEKYKITEIWEHGTGFDTLYFLNLRLTLAQKYGIDIELIQGSSTAKNAILYQGYRYTYFRIFETTFHNDCRNNEKQLLEKIRNLENRSSGSKPLADESTIKFLYDSYIEGRSLREIADKLNSEGVETKRGGKWFKSTVKYMLTNKRYVKMGIVTIEQYYKVRDMLKGDKKV